MFGLNLVKVGSEVWTLELVTNIHFTKTSIFLVSEDPQNEYFLQKKIKIEFFVCLHYWIKQSVGLDDPKTYIANSKSK